MSETASPPPPPPPHIENKHAQFAARDFHTISPPLPKVKHNKAVYILFPCADLNANIARIANAVQCHS